MSNLIDRRTAIDALWKALYEYEDKTEKQFIDSEELDVADWIQHRIFVQNMSDIDRQTILGLPSAQPDLDSAYTEGYTAAESKYRKMWDEMQATKQDAVEDTWDLFQMISSAWYGKGCYYKQNDGSVYSRLSCSYMTFDDAVREFMEEIDDD